MDSRRRVPVFIRGSKRVVGTVISPINSPGPRIETVEFEGIRVEFWRYHQAQVAYAEFDSLASAQRWPSFEPVMTAETPEGSDRPKID